MAKSQVIDKDRGLKDLSKKVAESKGLTLTVGIHGEDGAQAHGPLTVADIATVHEYGLGHVPPRSFIRAWADENEAEHKEILRKIGKAVVKRKFSANVGLERAGNLFMAQVQERIAGNIPPPLHPATIKAKGSSVALINTGQMRSSIRYKVSGGTIGQKLGRIANAAAKAVSSTVQGAVKTAKSEIKAGTKAAKKAAKAGVKSAKKAVKSGVKSAKRAATKAAKNTAKKLGKQISKAIKKVTK
jgi:hypothetical protein